jgi:hypothetical protein
MAARAGKRFRLKAGLQTKSPALPLLPKFGVPPSGGFLGGHQQAARPYQFLIQAFVLVVPEVDQRSKKFEPLMVPGYL